MNPWYQGLEQVWNSWSLMLRKRITILTYDKQQKLDINMHTHTHTKQTMFSLTRDKLKNLKWLICSSQIMLIKANHLIKGGGGGGHYF